VEFVVEGGSRKVIVFLAHRSHSISFTRAQGIPKYKLGFVREEGWESWECFVEEGGGVTVPGLRLRFFYA
jgi:hypothetical protein